MSCKFYTLDGKFVATGYFYEYENFTGIIQLSTCKEYHFEGKRHRVDGPAVIYRDGSKYWYFEGQLHSLDGPACEGINEPEEWFAYNFKFGAHS